MRRVFILSLLFSIIPLSVLAQAPEIGRIALYADSFRTTNEVDVPVPLTQFDLYIFCQPNENGMYCAEFALKSSTESMVISNTDWHPGLSVVLGDLGAGVSACFLYCQTDWVCISRVTMFNTIAGPATIDIVRHPDVGYYQFASCLEERPIEPVFIGPNLCINSACPLDTDPPVPLTVIVENDTRLLVYFDEKIFEPDAVDASSYHIYRTGIPEDSIPVNFAQLQGDEDRVWMILGGSLAAAPYTLEIRGLRDVAGNPAAPGTGIVFGGMDTTPPELLYAYAPEDTSVVLVFSEMLDETTAEDRLNYSIAGGVEYTPVPLSAELQADGISVKVILNTTLQQGQIYEVSVEGVADIAGNLIVPPAFASFGPPDIVPPYITQASITEDTALTMIWNEALDPVSAVDLANYSMFKDGPPAEPMTLVSADLTSGIHLRLNFNPATIVEETYTLYISGVMDTSMNAMLPDTLNMAPLDTIPPVLIGAACMGTQIVDLTFSERVNPLVTGCWNRFQIYPLGNMQDAMEIIDISIPGQENVVRLQLMFGMTPGSDYTARVLSIPDLAGNSIPSQQLDFTCYDVFPPEVTEIYLSDLTHVNIRFNEMVNAAAAEAASYLLYETVDSTATVGIESAALYDGATRAILTTTVPLNIGEMYTLKMNGIGDLLGNMIDPDKSWIFAADDTIDPVLLSLTVTSDSLVHLEFNETLDSVTAEDIAKYAVVEAGDTSVKLTLQSATLDSAGTIVDLEIDGQGGIGTSYVVWIMGVTDVAGNALYAASDAFQFIDDIPPRILFAEGASTRRVVVHFNEAVTKTTAQDENNYKLYLAGDPLSEIVIFDADRRPDEASVDLVLAEDLEHGADYTLDVSGVMDLAGHVMEPATVDFNFIDVSPPVILNVDLLNPTRLSIDFSEPVDSVTASDTGNYSVYLSSNASQQITVTSVDWMTDEVRLNLASAPQPNVDYTVGIDGVEDRFGNACFGLYGYFRYDVYVPSTKIYLYADDGRNSQKVGVGLYQNFRIYVWVEPGGNGVFAVEYALSPAQTYTMTGVTLNPVYASVAIGDPFNGHSIALSMCAHDWFWVDYIDCICLIQNVQERVWPVPHPDVGVIQVASCLPGHPLEQVVAAYPLLINAVDIGTLLDSWDASFKSGGIELTWSILETEATPEFEVSRTLENIEAWQPLPGGLIHSDGLKYTMVDSDLEFGLSYRYRVECIDGDGRKVLFETDAVATPAMPLTLRQNSPNPFNPSTSIGFFLPQPGHVRLEIFDVNGRLVNVLTDGHHASGEHSVEWDGRDRGGSNVTSGVYFYRLIAGKESLSRKMVLLR